MDQPNTDVNQQAPAAPVQGEEQTPVASEGVTTPADKVDRNVYEKVREAMKSEREAKRAKEAEIAQLQERIAKLEQTKVEDPDYDPYKAKTDLLFLMNKDPFVKENLYLIEQKMTDNPALDINAAVREIKAEFFDRIQKESSAVPNPTLKQERPTATPEPVKPQPSGNLLKDALDGKVENVPNEQLAAIKRVMGR